MTTALEAINDGKVVRIVSWQGVIHVYRYRVDRISTKGQIITGIQRTIKSYPFVIWGNPCPDGVFGGIKPGRLRQFNQCYSYQSEHVLLTIPRFFEEDLAFFKKKTGIQKVEVRPC